MANKPQPLMPLSYRKYGHLSDRELLQFNRLARCGELMSDEALALIIEMHRRGHNNDLTSLLSYLADLR